MEPLRVLADAQHISVLEFRRVHEERDLVLQAESGRDHLEHGHAVGVGLLGGGDVEPEGDAE
eukprot:3309811-Rhodomonas_salina.1